MAESYYYIISTDFTGTYNKQGCLYMQRFNQTTIDDIWSISMLHSTIMFQSSCKSKLIWYTFKKSYGDETRHIVDQHSGKVKQIEIWEVQKRLSTFLSKCKDIVVNAMMLIEMNMKLWKKFITDIFMNQRKREVLQLLGCFCLNF